METISQEQLLLHCQELLTSLFSIYEQNLFVDAVLHCGGQEIKAHRLVLAAFSPLLREQLRLSNISGNLGVDHVYLDDLGVGATTIKVIVDFMYLGWLNTKDESHTDLLACAKVMNIPLAVAELEQTIKTEAVEVKGEVVDEVAVSQSLVSEQEQVVVSEKLVDANGFPNQPDEEVDITTDVVMQECDFTKESTLSTQPIDSAVSVCVLGSKDNTITLHNDPSTASYTGSVQLESTSDTSCPADTTPLQLDVMPMTQPVASFARSDLFWRPAPSLQLEMPPLVLAPKPASVPSKRKHSTGKSKTVVADSPSVSRPKRKAKTKFVEAMKAKADCREKKFAKRNIIKHSGSQMEKKPPSKAPLSLAVSNSLTYTPTASESDVVVMQHKVSSKVKRKVKEEPCGSDESRSVRNKGSKESDDKTWTPDIKKASHQSKKGFSKTIGKLGSKYSLDVKPLIRKTMTRLRKPGQAATTSKCKTKKPNQRPEKADRLTKSKPVAEEKQPDTADLDLELSVKPDKCHLRTFEVLDGMLDSTGFTKEKEKEHIQRPAKEDQLELKVPPAVPQEVLDQDKNKQPVKSFNLDIKAMCKHQIKQGSCDVCNEATLEMKRLMKSVSFDSKTGQAMCGLCGFMCVNKWMSRHMKTHAEVRQFLCRYCSRTFRQRNSLEVHERTHTGERPFICGFCGRAFIGVSGLKSHERLHTGDRPYQCDRCACSYASKNGLTLHQGRIHQIGKSYPCAICGKVFWDSNTYNEHKNRHTGAVLYQCPQCLLSFRSNGDLRRHYRKNHPEVSLSRSARGSLKKLFEGEYKDLAEDSNVVVEGCVLDES